MKSWNETAAVFAEMARLKAEGRVCALATLTKIEGSAYRKPGARLLIRDDKSLVGNVSGGCLEEDLRDRAVRVMESGKAERVHYDTGSDEDVLWGLGLGCNGKIDIHLERGPVDGLETILEKLATQEPFDITAGDFTETLRPPAQLVVIGAGDDAIPVVQLATEAGFRVTIVDHRASHLTKDRFPDAWRAVQRRPEAGLTGLPQDANTLVVIMNHHLIRDRDWAVKFLPTPVRFIGLLGPIARRNEILKAIPAEHHTRYHGPVGLPIAAEGPVQIAVSIVAQLLQAVGR